MKPECSAIKLKENVFSIIKSFTVKLKKKPQSKRPLSMLTP